MKRFDRFMLAIILAIILGTVAHAVWTVPADLPQQYDEAFVHRAGEHHLNARTTEAMYAYAWAAYKLVHPDALLPTRLPRIGFATSKGICEAIHSAQDRDCALAVTGGEFAQYPLPDDVDIIFDETLDYDENLLASSIVFHEFVHYLQSFNGGLIMLCELAVAREHEAYFLQARWLEAHGGHGYVFRVMAASAKQHCANQP